MAEIVNLNQYKKAKARAEKANKARDNRAKFGRKKSQKRESTELRRRVESELDGKKLEKPEG